MKGLYVSSISNRMERNNRVTKTIKEKISKVLLTILLDEKENCDINGRVGIEKTIPAANVIMANLDTNSLVVTTSVGL